MQAGQEVTRDKSKQDEILERQPRKRRRPAILTCQRGQHPAICFSCKLKDFSKAILLFVSLAGRPMWNFEKIYVGMVSTSIDHMLTCQKYSVLADAVVMKGTPSTTTTASVHLVM
jgi:hypothetical protein